MSDARVHDLVRVRAVPAWSDPASVTAPGLGDRGAIVQVLPAPDLPDRLLVECCESRGSTLWLAEFARDALEPAPITPCEPLTLDAMASGQQSLDLGRDVSRAAFPEYAQRIAQRLSAKIVDAVEDPVELLLTLAIESRRYWLVWEAHARHVSLDPCDADAGAHMAELKLALLRSRGAMDAVFRVRDEPGDFARVDCGVGILDFLLRDELGRGGQVDEDSLTIELARQIRDVRLGRIPRALNGSDAVFVTIEPEGVRFEYAMPGAVRPGDILVSLHSFADVFTRWFEHVNPALGAAIREIIWPRAARL